jgi:hypothetical protein
VLLHSVEADPQRFGSEAEVGALRVAIDRREVEVEDKAGALGRQLLAERPRALAERFARYWKTAA